MEKVEFKKMEERLVEKKGFFCFFFMDFNPIEVLKLKKENRLRQRCQKHDGDVTLAVLNYHKYTVDRLYHLRVNP